jgi:mono/diheme cytochrome c family protein
MQRRSRVGSIGLLCLLAVAAGCPGDRDAPPPPAQQPGAPAAAPSPAQPAPAGDLISQGQQVYSGAGICFTCHGPAGQGTALGPNLTDGEWIWVDTSQDLQQQIVTITRTGVTQPREYPAPMPPMGGANLSEDQLQAVAAYILSLNP